MIFELDRIRDYWPWMSKLRHRQEMVIVLRNAAIRQESQRKMFQEVTAMNKEIYRVAIDVLVAQINELTERLQ